MLVMREVVYLLNVRRMSSPAVSRHGLAISRPVLVAITVVVVWQLLFTYAPPMQAVFDSTGIGLAAWGRILAAATLVFVLIEIEKLLLTRRNRPS